MEKFRKTKLALFIAAVLMIANTCSMLYLLNTLSNKELDSSVFWIVLTLCTTVLNAIFAAIPTTALVVFQYKDEDLPEPYSAKDPDKYLSKDPI